VASSVHGRVQRRQRSRWADQHRQLEAQAQAAAPPPASAAAPAADIGDKLAQLKQLGELRDAGVLTGAEFEVQKARILHT
jgi:hypothetical protein